MLLGIFTDLSVFTRTDAEEGLSGVDIEFSIEDGEGEEQDDDGDTGTETGESPAPRPETTASRIQGQWSTLGLSPMMLKYEYSELSPRADYAALWARWTSQDPCNSRSRRVQSYSEPRWRR